MATFILLTKLSSDNLSSFKKRETVGRKWLGKVKEDCPEVKWLEHYALLGPFDFMDIYEAPSPEVAAKVSMITMSRGAVKAETWAALPYKKYMEIAKTL